MRSLVAARRSHRGARCPRSAPRSPPGRSVTVRRAAPRRSPPRSAMSSCRSSSQLKRSRCHGALASTSRTSCCHRNVRADRHVAPAQPEHVEGDDDRQADQADERERRQQVDAHSTHPAAAQHVEQQVGEVEVGAAPRRRRRRGGDEGARSRPATRPAARGSGRRGRRRRSPRSPWPVSLSTSRASGGTSGSSSSGASTWRTESWQRVPARSRSASR